MLVYSFRSLLSANAFPLSSSLWASTGGAVGWVASCALMDAIESVGWTESVKDAGGLRDLKTREIVAVWCQGLF